MCVCVSGRDEETGSDSEIKNPQMGTTDVPLSLTVLFFQTPSMSHCFTSTVENFILSKSKGKDPR